MSKASVRVMAAFLAVVLLASALTGCGGSKSAGNTTGDQKVKLNVAVLVGVYGERAKELKAQFEQEHPNIELAIEELPYEDVIKKEILDASSHTKKYDVYTVINSELGGFAKPGYLVPLTDYIKNEKLTSPDLALDDYYPAYLKGITQFNGVQYTMPYQFWVMAFYYRKDLFADQKNQEAFKAKYGYELAVPKTLDQFKDMAAFFTRDTNGDGKTDMYGFGMDGLRGGPGANTYQFYPFLWAFGGDIFDQNYRPVFNSEAGVKALEYYKSLVAYSPQDWVQGFCDINTSLFQQGIVTMSIHDSDQFGYINDPKTSKPEVVGNVALATPPAGPVGQPVIHLAGWSMGVSADSAHKDEAYTYIQWMASKGRAETQAKYGEPPARKSWLENPDNIAKHPEYKGMVEALPNAKSIPSIPEFGQVTDIVALAVQQALLGEKTPQAALDEAAAQVQKVMETAGYYK